MFGHVQRRDSGHIGRRMLEMELPGRRRRGRPKRRYIDTVKEDMQIDRTENRAKWKTVIRCGDPRKKGKAIRRRSHQLIKYQLFYIKMHIILSLFTFLVLC